ncbi:MAG TPA: GTPase HflX [Bacteroidetes bacterium]|nr:GTPase HflX [Bacteroidota bacterium]
MSEHWQIGKKDKKSYLNKTEEKAILVGVIHNNTEEEVLSYLDELEFLAQTAGATTVKVFTQRLKHIDTKFFIGKGKIEEIKNYIEYREDIDMVIFDDDLSGKQTTNLEEALGVKIIDRSTLILDIFAKRAKKAQAKAQVELAQLQYLLPRLRGLWTHLERQRGGIGMRGPGEQEIETDRRIVKDKIKKLKETLATIDKQDKTRRKKRDEMIRVSLVGYTNVGKSTLMNLLTKSEVFTEDKLFATLDTTVRKMVLGRMPFLLSDTVGFIRKLPHHLVESFKSTLDEVRESDVLLHVIDVSHPQFEDQISTVNQTLKELGAVDKTTVYVFNKIDRYREQYFDKLLEEEAKETILSQLKDKLKNDYGDNVIFISAKEKENILAFKDLLQSLVEDKYKIRYPYKTHYW